MTIEPEAILGDPLPRAEELRAGRSAAATAPACPASPQTWLATARARKNTAERRDDAARATTPAAGVTSPARGSAPRAAAGTPSATDHGQRAAASPVAGRPVVEERADHGEAPWAKFTTPEAAVDEDEPLPGQGIDGTDAETEQDEAEELVQGAQPVTKSLTSRNAPSPDGTISPSLISCTWNVTRNTRGSAELVVGRRRVVNGGATPRSTGRLFEGGRNERRRVDRVELAEDVGEQVDRRPTR